MLLRSYLGSPPRYLPLPGLARRGAKPSPQTPLPAGEGLSPVCRLSDRTGDRRRREKAPLPGGRGVGVRAGRRPCGMQWFSRSAHFRQGQIPRLAAEIRSEQHAGTLVRVRCCNRVSQTGDEEAAGQYHPGPGELEGQHHREPLEREGVGDSISSLRRRYLPPGS